MDKTVLAYIFKDNQVLMLFRNKKENDINEGKWMGVGGHLEPGETKEQALVREIKEETNLDVVDYKFIATLFFYNGDYEEVMYLYKVDKCTGELKECDEGELKYFPIQEIYKLNMWEGDHLFLDRLLNNEPYFELALYYSGDKLTKVVELK